MTHREHVAGRITGEHMTRALLTIVVLCACTGFSVFVAAALGRLIVSVISQCL